MVIRYEQVNGFGLCHGGYDLDLLAPTTEDLRFLYEWFEAVQPPLPPSEACGPGKLFAFKPEGEQKFQEWLQLYQAVALHPVVRRELVPSQIVWEDDWQVSFRE